MDDEIIPSLRSPVILRARFLKAALRSGAPPSLTRYDSESLANPSPETSADHGWTDSPEIQRAYLEQLVESAPEAISILDPQYRVMRINSEFTRMFGYTPEEVLGKNIEALIVPPHLMLASKLMEEAARQQKFSSETKCRRKDGSLLDVSILGTPVNFAGGRVALYAIYRDVSERKRAEALNSALYRIAEKTSSAEDLNQFYSAIHSILGELMDARNLYIALYDTTTQLISFPYWVDEQDPRPAPRSLSKGLTDYVLRTGEPLLAAHDVFEGLLRRGEVDLIGAPSIDWLGVPLKLGNTTIGVAVVQSYTENIRFSDKDKEILTFVSQQLASAIEHKRHEEALRASEARYRSLVDSAVYGIYRSSLDGRFLNVNPALIGMLGYKSADEILKLDPPKDVFLNPEEHSRLMRECRPKGQLDNFETKWKRGDGIIITVRLSGRTVASEGEPGEFLEIIAEDVTEKRMLEDQFRQAQKMEAVGRLAGGLAHDFNNLLLVISGYTELLLENMERSNALYAKAEAIQQSADRATTLTRQLLAFSRKQLMELKVVDVNTIVSDMERLLKPLIGETIELSTQLSKGLGRTRADAGQLEQVIMNLVVNAKDAMANGGKITIRTANTVLDDSYRRDHTFIRPGAYIMLSVTDCGCGMDKETQSRIFEPFFTTKEKSKGTGLGLSTVYGVVKQSGGYIFAQSEIGHGTTFRIYLPRVEDAPVMSGPVTNCNAKTRGWGTILLVEDEESVRQLVRETLETGGYQVIEAKHGQAALELAADLSGPIHLMITDVVMPGISGRDLARELAKTRPQTKVLFLSGYTEDAVLNEGDRDLTAAAFLQKPFTLQVLSRKVREVLE